MAIVGQNMGGGGGYIFLNCSLFIVVGCLNKYHGTYKSLIKIQLTSLLARLALQFYSLWLHTMR